MLTASDFILRRARLFDSLQNAGAKVIIYGREPLKRIPSVLYNFHQFSDLLYLTGYDRAGGALTLEVRDSKLYSTLFLPQRNRTEELWNGIRTSFPDAQELSGVDRVRPITELEDWVVKNTGTCPIFFSCPPQQQPHSRTFKSLTPYIDALRWVKDEKERALIKRACEITKRAFSEVSPQPGDLEGVLAAQFQHRAAHHGATGLAYPIVAASGDNALCLHYLENNTVMKEGRTVMMDAGCEYHHYASDFTRTFPIGRIPSAHLDLLEMVSSAKDELIARVRAGRIFNLAHLHQQAEQMLARGLRGFGVRAEGLAIRRFFPHGVSHWIGLDVHDCDTVSHTLPFKRGCVFSVEPGLYFAHDDRNAPEELKGLGCRFEDTVILD